MEEKKMKEEFLVLVNQNKGIIYRISRLYGETGADREDLFQEILLNLWKGYASFRNESKFSTWLYRIALNTCITAYRKLDKFEKAIIILYLEEKSYEEIAEIAGIIPNHAGVKITRIKTKLRQYLNHENL